MNQSDNKTFIELGPWVRGLSYLEQDDIDEGKQFLAPNHAHLHKRTFLRLPRVTQPLQSSTKKSKGVLKMSHQSLDFTQPAPVTQPSSKSRYGALNGSIILKAKSPLTGRSVQLPREDSNTIDTASLQRKVSTVQMGEPIITHRVLRGKGRRLMNEECAKKRGLMQFIREVALNKDFMKFYLEHKSDRAYSNHLDL